MKENIRLSIRGIKAHKMRSFLTMLGIIIGIASIISIVSTIKGTNEQIEKNLIGSGDNMVNVVLNKDDWEYDMTEGIPSGIPKIQKELYNNLKEIEHVEGVSLYKKRQEFDVVSYKEKKVNGVNVLGISQDYLDTASLTVLQGRGLTETDNEKAEKVCLLDQQIAEQLFSGEKAVGGIIEIHGVPFTVAGIVKNKKAFQPDIQSMDDYYMFHTGKTGAIYIPDAAWPVIYQYDEPSNILLRSDKTSNMTAIGKEAEKILNEKNENKDGIVYKTQDLVEQAKQIQQLSKSTNMMLIWIAAISLLVGGIGVMNIMLVTVTERTKEIGLKKAIGAKKKTILFQFLTESVVLTSLGGAAGIVTGIVLAKLISIVNGTPVSISAAASLIAFIFSMGIGIIFGILPSMKASNLDPIDALRYE